MHFQEMLQSNTITIVVKTKVKATLHTTSECNKTCDRADLCEVEKTETALGFAGCAMFRPV